MLRYRAARVGGDSEPAQQGVGGAVADLEQHGVVGQPFAPAGAAQHDGGGLHALDGGTEAGGDAAVRDAVLDLRAHPVLDRRAQRRGAMNQRHPGAGGEQLQRGLDGGVAAAHHGHVAPVVGVAVGKVMGALGQLLAGDAEAARGIEEAGGHHQGGAALLMPGAAALHGHGEAGAVAARARHRAAGADRQREVVGHGAVVGDRLAAARLAVGTGERQAADGQLLRGGEEGHVGGEAVDGVDHGALLEDNMIQPGAGGGDGAGQSGGTGANDDQLARFHCYLTGERRRAQHTSAPPAPATRARRR